MCCAVVMVCLKPRVIFIMVFISLEYHSCAAQASISNYANRGSLALGLREALWMAPRLYIWNM
jgi:hypothetical protein